MQGNTVHPLAQTHEVTQSTSLQILKFIHLPFFLLPEEFLSN